jgi:hypothetical protein
MQVFSAEREHLSGVYQGGDRSDSRTLLCAPSLRFAIRTALSAHPDRLGIALCLVAATTRCQGPRAVEWGIVVVSPVVL